MASIINTHLKQLSDQDKLQTESTLIEIFAHLTQSESPLDPTTVPAKRRVAQQGFLENFLVRISKLTYKFCEEPCVYFDENEMITDSTESLVDIEKGLSSEQILKSLEEMESNNEAPDTNLLIENTFRLASNVTDLHETHYMLVMGESRLLDLVYGVFQ